MWRARGSSASAAITRRQSLFFSRRRRHTRFSRDWSSDVCSSDLDLPPLPASMRAWLELLKHRKGRMERVFAYGYDLEDRPRGVVFLAARGIRQEATAEDEGDRKSVV